LRALTDPDARGGEYFGPAGFGGIRGRAVRARPAPAALDEQAAVRLWELSERLTGVTFALPGHQPRTE
jgi:protochlorophyllide reductase